ncbi:PAS domain S-box protein [Cytobacillus depressus]|uniref:HTH-type transcriptional regulatory protein TyrR n=1 Tax=Cytobacillus depressus TaxID=1602942 RepID=A0A6L3V8W8_9BACI|nr:sigma 54-interacting transcriptional regulator [Cytobacillus depressus]KAB2338050.1 PAS domain S-box protein [Cytobacillus depressus]
MTNRQLENYRQAFEELNSILEMNFEAITIANSEGIFTKISKSFEEKFGITQSDIIGQSAFKLEKEGFFDRSVTCEVLKKKKKVTIIQKAAANKILLVTGIPIFNKNKEIQKIINISKDITETKKLESDLNNLQIEHEWLKQELFKRTNDKDRITYESVAMNNIVTLIDHVAKMDATVLLLGETGVGKGFITKLVHEKSGRRDGPFITINCGAIPENLLESELFGYEKGSFTGASKEGKKGLFEMAENGTIFLDEIGDMPLSLQVKLLHVLDERKVRRIGGFKSIDVNARVIAATNKNLKELVKKGDFREDLFYRLNVVPITIPSLRERKEDLPSLINMFLSKTNNKYGVKKTISEEAMRSLYDYEYPGNIRELQNLIERLVITTIGDKIEAAKVFDIIEPIQQKNMQDIIPLKEAVEQLEKKLLLSAFKKYKTTRKVAEALQIDQSTVVKKANKFQLKTNIAKI